MTEQDTYDVLVVGAGPAGCTAASILAGHGRKVAIVEREPLPRYRIGESLIPHCWFALDRLGLVERLNESSFVVEKNSVQFVNDKGVRSKPFYFFEHSDHPKSRTWQVKRKDFDQLLLEGALERGVRLYEQTAAKDLLRDDECRVTGVLVEDACGERRQLHAKITIDASGRDLFAVSRNRWRVSDPRLKKVALWTYYEGAKRDPGVDEGATTIAYLSDKDWFWYLPLADDIVSVGVVADADYLFRDEKDHKTIFEREVARQPWIAEHVAPGCPTGEYKVTRDFSYRSRYCAEDGLVLCGDAFAFLDPVFSSGVFLALQGGVLCGDAVEAALAANDVSAARFEDYGDRVCQSIEGMRRLVHAFYDPKFSFGDFFKKYPERRAEVTDVLIGDLEKDFDGLYSDMREFAEIPERLSHGGPLLRE